MNQNYKPIIIIGAPRSGTNMLRDLLVKLDGFVTWPCDEINYIWRYGNRSHPSDEFSESMATENVKRFVRKQFQKQSRHSNGDIVVEKTCANSLRVNFINQIFPDAKYIFIVRDGIDVVGSAKKRWKAKLDVPYLVKKARYVPIADVPYYASKYFFSRIYKVFSNDGRLNIWGPQLANVDQLLSDYSLDEVCALQWSACVNASEKQLGSIDSSRVHSLRYEDFVRSPSSHLLKLSEFVGVSCSEAQADQITANVSSTSVGKGRNQLNEELVKKIEDLVDETLNRYDYK